MQSTAILVVGFNRPDLLERLLRHLQEGELKNIVVSIDSDFSGKHNEQILNLQQYKFPKLDWRFRKKNLGVGLHVPFAVTEVLTEYSNCIVLEDDVFASIACLVSLTEKLEEGLPEKCMTVGLFGGIPYNPLLKYVLGPNRWRKTEYFSAWAWGVTATSWKKYEHLLIASELEKNLTNSKIWPAKTADSKNRWLSRFQKVCHSPNFTWDFQMQYSTYKNDSYHLLPIYRSADNLGFGDIRSTNTKSTKPNWYVGKTIGRSVTNGDISNNLIQTLCENIDRLTWAGDSDTRSSIGLVMRRMKNRLEI